MQRYNYSELNVNFDRNVGTLIVLNSSSTVRLSVDVLADPCPSVVWMLNGTALGPNNSNITFNNPCIEGASTSLNIWTYTLNVVVTSDTSGHYLANFTNIAGTTFLHRTYFTIPGMFYTSMHESKHQQIAQNSCSLSVTQSRSLLLVCH